MCCWSHYVKKAEVCVLMFKLVPIPICIYFAFFSINKGKSGAELCVGFVFHFYFLLKILYYYAYIYFVDGLKPLISNSFDVSILCTTHSSRPIVILLKLKIPDSIQFPWASRAKLSESLEIRCFTLTPSAYTQTHTLKCASHSHCHPHEFANECCYYWFSLCRTFDK